MFSNLSVVNVSLTDQHNEAVILSHQGFVILTSVLIVCGCVGLLQNAVIISTFTRVRELRSATNMFIVSLSVCDVLIALFGIPLEAASSASGRWLFGQTGCSWHGFIMSFLGYTSINILTAISLERYLLVTKPLSRPGIITNKAMHAILFCWALGFLWAIFPVIGWSSYTLEGALISCSVNWRSNHPLDLSYVVTVFTFCFFLPIGIIIFSYYKVFRTVHSFARRSVRRRNSLRTKRRLNVEYRTTRNILLTIGAFLLCWTPYAVVSLWSAFGNPEELSPVAGIVSTVIAKSAIVWNPMVYVVTNTEFRSYLSAVQPCRVRDQTKTSSERIKMATPTKLEHVSKNSKHLNKSTKMTKMVMKFERNGSNCYHPIINDPSILDEKDENLVSSASRIEIVQSRSLEESIVQYIMGILTAPV